MSTGAHAGFLETMLNLSRYHREHEKFYARAPLAEASRGRAVGGSRRELTAAATRS